jgi:protocatechuate 3,4-dioxygenase beta subunit
MVNLRRRDFVWGIALISSVGLAPALSRMASAQKTLPLTASCDDDDEATVSQTEGPYFSPNSPERWNFREPDIEGTPILLTGFVLTRRCIPVSRALVELWHANSAGRYDIEGYRLRGHQSTDDAGQYRFSTIVPGLYPGRTRHFHLKFQAPGHSLLTTQFYFPNEPDNERDRLFNPELLLTISKGSELVARFDVVLG